MSVYFFDASAIVKRYLLEAGSEWVRQIIAHEQPRIFISALSGAEVFSAIMRKGRTREVTLSERDKALSVFRQEFTTRYAVLPPGSGVIQKAMDLLLTSPLRAYDAVQLASVLVLPPPPHGTNLIFVSADEGLLSVTKQLGLLTENPNLHT
ncbi:MAG: type II toxin-antitoxin system VapC family toxin [Candidatus Binatia bacterium]